MFMSDTNFVYDKATTMKIYAGHIPVGQPDLSMVVPQLANASYYRYHIFPVWNRLCSVLIGNVNENRTTMHYFGIPWHTQSMIAYKILTEYFWKFHCGNVFNAPYWMSVGHAAHSSWSWSCIVLCRKSKLSPLSLHLIRSDPHHFNHG